MEPLRLIVRGTFLELLKGNYFFVWKTEKQTFWALSIFVSDFGVLWCLDLMRPWELFLFVRLQQRAVCLGPACFEPPGHPCSLCCVIYHILTSLHLKNTWIFDKSVGKTIFPPLFYDSPVNCATVYAVKFSWYLICHVPCWSPRCQESMWILLCVKQLWLCDDLFLTQTAFDIFGSFCRQNCQGLWAFLLLIQGTLELVWGVCRADFPN